MRRKSKDDPQEKKRKTSFPLLLRKSDSATSVKSSSNDSTSEEIDQREKRRSIFEDEAPVDFFHQEELNTVSLSDEEDNVTPWKSSVGTQPTSKKSLLTDQLKNPISERSGEENYGKQPQTVISTKLQLTEATYVPNEQTQTEDRMRPESNVRSEIVLGTTDSSSCYESEDLSQIKLTRCPGLLESLKEDLESLINVFDKDDRAPDWKSPEALRSACVNVSENNGEDKKGNLVVRCYSNPDSFKDRELESQTRLDRQCLERTVSASVSENKPVPSPRTTKKTAAGDKCVSGSVKQDICDTSSGFAESETPTPSPRSSGISFFQSVCSSIASKQEDGMIPFKSDSDGMFSDSLITQEKSGTSFTRTSNCEYSVPTANRLTQIKTTPDDSRITLNDSVVGDNVVVRHKVETKVTNRKYPHQMPETTPQDIASNVKRARNMNIALNSDVSDLEEFNKQLSPADSDVFYDSSVPVTEDSYLPKMTMSIDRNSAIPQSDMKITKSQSFTVESQQVDKNCMYRSQSVVVLQEGKFHTYIKKRNSVSGFDALNGSCSLKNFRDSSILDLKRRESLQDKFDMWVLQLHPINKTEVFV